MAVEQPPPEVLALVLADNIHRDGETGKYFILGTRYFIGAASFPYHHPALAIYAAFVEGRGETAFRFRLIDADEEREAVTEYNTVLIFPDPLIQMELAVVLTDLVFPDPGDYRLQLFVDDRFLREHRLLIIPLENSEQP